MSSWTLVDLADDRRAGKSLPADDRDVTNGLVVADHTGLPSCVAHGAMNRIDPTERLYRCQACGVGARAVKNDSAAPTGRLHHLEGT